jgi:hypothetical protein
MSEIGRGPQNTEESSGNDRKENACDKNNFVGSGRREKRLRESERKRSARSGNSASRHKEQGKKVSGSREESRRMSRSIMSVQQKQRLKNCDKNKNGVVI